MSTPALARAYEAHEEEWSGLVSEMQEDAAHGNTPMDEGEFSRRIVHATVSAALHDPDDDVIARTLREHGIRGSSGTGPEPWTSSCWAPGCGWRGDSSSHSAHQADAVRAAILGTGS